MGLVVMIDVDGDDGGHYCGHGYYSLIYLLQGRDRVDAVIC